MLIRTTHPNGVVTYQSPLLARTGARHAFSTRIGGVSQGPFATLNLGNPTNSPNLDSHENLLQNYHLLQQAIAASDCLRAFVNQVHGRMVELVDFEPEGEYAETLAAELRDRFSGQLHADALLTAVPRVLLTVRIADCVPLLLVTPDGTTVAAVHAGWRGVVGNIAEKTVRSFGELGIQPQTLLAAIGPCISLENFEIGPEVAEEFSRQNLAASVAPRFAGGEKPHINLQLAVHTQLVRAGLLPQNIDGNSLCTYRDSTDFFSHRRDNALTGRLAAVITPRV